MRFAWQILIHTPSWVFVLFAYLVWQGLRARRPRTVTIWRSLIVPAVFIVWGLSGLLLRRPGSVWPLTAWAAAALLLAPAGLLTTKPFKLDHETGEISRPGSFAPLIRNLTVFALQYTVAVIAAIHPNDATVAAIVGRAISGATTGYFLGRTIALLRQYRKQRQADVTT
jgi:hypothetical protein